MKDEEHNMIDENQSAVDTLDTSLPDAGDDIAIALDEAEVTTEQKNELPNATLEADLEISADSNLRENNASVSSAMSDIKEPKQSDGLDIASSGSEIPDTLMANVSSEESLTPLGGNVMSIKKIQNIKVNIQVILGSVSLSISRLASLKKGELLSLDTSIGDPIEILANGQLIARGEIVVLGEETPKFGISLIEIVDSDVSVI